MTSKKNTWGLLLLLSFFFFSCENDEVESIEKEGAIETIVSVNHLNIQYDIIQTTYKIWANNQLSKTIVHTDTIPSLGLMIETLDNSSGETIDVDLNKDYELYITVK